MQITFLNGEQAILYINKNAVQNTQRCALYITQHSTAAKRQKACSENEFLPEQVYVRRYGIYYKIAKAERILKNKQTKKHFEQFLPLGKLSLDN